MRTHALDCLAVLVLSTATLFAGNLEAGDIRLKNVEVLVPENGGRVDWSHENNRIAFSKIGSDEYYDVFTMRADGTDMQCLTCNHPGIPQRNNGQPAWHPSGQFIVFQSQSPDLNVPFFLSKAEKYLTQGGAGLHNNLWLMTKDGQKYYRLTDLKSREFIIHPHFSHRGDKLLWCEKTFEGRRFGAQWKLVVADFRLDADGTPHLENAQKYRPRGEKHTFYESHGFSVDDKSIIFSASIGRAHEFDMDIWTLDLNTQALTQLTDSENVWDEHAQYSPDGKTIVWISSQGYDFQPSKNWSKTLKTEYWMMNADGSNKRRLTYFNEPGHAEYTGSQTICADSSWDKTGDRLVAAQSVGDVKRIVLLNFYK